MIANGVECHALRKNDAARRGGKGGGIGTEIENAGIVASTGAIGHYRYATQGNDGHAGRRLLDTDGAGRSRSGGDGKTIHHTGAIGGDQSIASAEIDGHAVGNGSVGKLTGTPSLTISTMDTLLLPALATTANPAGE